MSEIKKKTGLVLSGGGARGAYQAGVLRGLTEIASENNLLDRIRIITGASAGAINASYLAASMDSPVQGANELCHLWSNLQSHHIFRTDAYTAGRSGMKLIADATLGAFYKTKLARSLLDTEPLWTLLRDNIKFENIPKFVEEDRLDALAITAMNYSNNVSETFFVGKKDISPWERARRAGFASPISTEHIMASSAIPLFFPPIKANNMYYGDGCLRNTAPLSPAIHLGSDQLIVVSVRRPDSAAVAAQQNNIDPTFARVLGVVLNALMLDAIDLDMERLIRVNGTVKHVGTDLQDKFDLKPLNWLWIRPSVDIGLLAGDYFTSLPKVIKYLIGGLGSSKEASELTSYLLFTPEFLTKLIDIGYADTLSMKVEVIDFLSGKKTNI